MNLSYKYNCDWLIIVVIKEVLGDQYFGITKLILKEMEDVGSPHNEVLLILDRIQELDNHELGFRTSFQRLIPSEHDSNVFTFKEFGRLVDFDYESSRSWIELLAWINDNYNSKRTITIFHSHGCGFGISGEKLGLESKPFKLVFNNEVYLSKQYAKYIDQLLSTKTDRFMPGSELRETQDYFVVSRNTMDKYCKLLEMLWITELEEALYQGFASRKVDIMMMVNCYMQTFDTGWILKNQVQYLVAPETQFEAYGYSFNALLDTLNTHPQISTKALLMKIKPQFKEKWLKNPAIGQKSLDRVTLVITKLSKYKTMKVLFEKISRVLMRCSDESLDKIIELRALKLQNVSNDPSHLGGDSVRVDFVDLMYLFGSIQNLFPENIFLKNCINQFESEAAASIIDIHVGQDFIAADSNPNNTAKFSINGISIYLPLNLASSKQTDIVNCAYFGKQVLGGVLPDAKKQIAVERFFRDKAILKKASRPHPTDPDPTPLFQFTSRSLWDDFITRYLQRLVMQSGARPELFRNERSTA